MEIGILGSSIPECGLKATNEDLSIDANVRIAGFGTWIFLELIRIIKCWKDGGSSIAVDVKAFRYCELFVRFCILVA